MHSIHVYSMIMFGLPCSYITTFLMETPNNINTSRLMRYVLMDLSSERL